jgi:hypothetical protein
MYDTSSQPPAAAVDSNITRRRGIHSEIVQHLREGLPFRDGMSEAGRRHMLEVAIGAVVALRPVDSMEVSYAAQQFVCLEHARICLAQARLCLADVVLVGKLRSQAAQMSREARSLLTALLKLQAARSKRDGKVSSDDADASDEGCIEARLDQAVAEAPSEPEPVPHPFLHERGTRGSAVPATDLAPPEPVPTPEEMDRRRLEQKVDEYTVIYPLRARVIRRLGGMPADAPFEAPEPALMAELLAANRSNQLWVDGMTPEEALIDGGQDRMGWPYEPDADPEVVRTALVEAGVDWRPGLPWNVFSAASVDSPA